MIHLDLLQLCRMGGLPEPTPEYRFHKERKWRIDYAFREPWKLAVEIDGGIWMHGRHTRGFGFLADMEKLNALTLEGWAILRFTPSMVKNGEALRVLEEWFKKKRMGRIAS